MTESQPNMLPPSAPSEELLIKRARCLARVNKWRAAHREEYLAKKRVYTSNHPQQRNRYAREHRARQKAQREAQQPDFEVVRVDLLAMLADMMRR